MYRSIRLFACLLAACLIAAAALPLLAQDDIPPAAGRGAGRGGGGRGSTRDFLGLGPAPDPGSRRVSRMPRGVTTRRLSTKSSIWV